MKELKLRVLEATGRCAMKFSLQRTTVEDIARESGVSRATIYRHFPDGRDEIIASTVTHEMDSFFRGLAADVQDAVTFEELLVAGLMSAARRTAEHELLQRVLAVEPQIVLPYVTVESRRVLDMLAVFVRPYAESDSPDSTSAELDRKCDYVARLFLSFVEAPGSWDLENAEQVRELVNTQFAV